ncbi:MAG: riboflavin synthase [Bacteroidales bacterium]|nr:riboflavin synthase [Bacteroidales bacterium]
MFTGIIEETGIIKAIKHGARSSQLTIQGKVVLEDLKEGDSISTNGVCLTVTSFAAGYFTADVMPETIRQTSLNGVRPGDSVNLERALRLMDRIGGHLMSGHVDGTGKIIRRREEDNSVWLTISAGQNILRYIVNKGSVALDGISLTVTTCDTNSFSVSVIPHTQVVTTLQQKKTGDLINIECDIMAKYIEKLYNREPGDQKIDLDFLAKNNYL